MGRWAFGALAVLLVAGVAAVPQAPQGPSAVAYVSTQIILRQTPGFAAAESTFNAEVLSSRNEVERLQRQLDSAVAAFDQQSVVLSPTARQERMTELRQQQQRFEQRSNELQARMQQRQQELMAPLEDRIQRVVDGLRAERNIGIVLDVSSPTSDVVSADPSLDLTQIVIQRLRGPTGQ